MAVFSNSTKTISVPFRCLKNTKKTIIKEKYQKEKSKWDTRTIKKWHTEHTHTNLNKLLVTKKMVSKHQTSFLHKTIRRHNYKHQESYDDTQRWKSNFRNQTLCLWKTTTIGGWIPQFLCGLTNDGKKTLTINHSWFFFLGGDELID